MLQVVFYVGVQLDITKPNTAGDASQVAEAPPSPGEVLPGEPSGKDLVAQRGVCGAVRVACRGLCPSGLRRSADHRCTLRPSMDQIRHSQDEVRPHPGVYLSASPCAGSARPSRSSAAEHSLWTICTLRPPWVSSGTVFTSNHTSCGCL